MNDNIYSNFKKYLTDWQNMLSNEMSKFWGKVSINELVKDTFNQYLNILQTNFNNLKNGTLTAEQVQDNIKKLNSLFKNNVDKLNKEISEITKEKFSSLINNE